MSDVSKTNEELRKALNVAREHFSAIAASGEIKVWEDTGEKRGIDYQAKVWAERGARLASEALAATRVPVPDNGKCGGCRDLGPHRNVPGCEYYKPVQGELNDDREALLRAILRGRNKRQEWWSETEDVSDSPSDDEFLADAILAAGFSPATVPDAATELTAIKARAEEVDEDEGWHVGGAWGDYGEVVVPLRILSYVVDGALDEKIVSTDPGYAATYAEQIARADRAEAERDAALAAVERVRAIHMPFTHPQFPGDRVYCKGCAVAGRGEKSWPCETRAALDGAPEPEEKP